MTKRSDIRHTARGATLAFLIGFALVLGGARAAAAAGPKAGQVAQHFETDASKLSWTNAYILSYLSDIIYPRLVSAKDWGQFKRNFSKIMYRQGWKRVVPYQNRKTHTQLAVLVSDKAVVVVFRGTEARGAKQVLGDVIKTDLRITFKTVRKWGKGVRIHAGFYRAFKSVWRWVHAMVVKYGAGGRRKVWVTGHSLGGALAHLTAYALTRARVTVQGVMTFGAPRLSSRRFQTLYNRALKARTQRFSHGSDPIVHVLLKLLGYRNVGTCYAMYRDGNIRRGHFHRDGCLSMRYHSLYPHYLWARLGQLGGKTAALRQSLPSPPNTKLRPPKGKKKCFTLPGLNALKKLLGTTVKAAGKVVKKVARGAKKLNKKVKRGWRKFKKLFR